MLPEDFIKTSFVAQKNIKFNFMYPHETLSSGEKCSSYQLHGVLAQQA